MKKKGSKNLTRTQRLQIETLFNAKMHKKEIAERVGVCIRTIHYELKRGAYEHTKRINDFWTGIHLRKAAKYSCDLAQQRYEINCTSKGRPLKVGKDFAFIHYIEKRCNEERLSPCAVLGQIKREKMPFETNISKTTLYRYIANGIFANLKIEKRKQKYKHVVIKRVSKGTSIEKRPKEVLYRKTFGHWEMDCVCGSTKSVLLVLSERLTRKEIIFKMKAQTSKSVVACLNKLERHYGRKFKKIFRSITMDNGSEFSDYAGIEKSIFGKNKRTVTYYCHPYCSSERGTNERLNREIRRLIPKGSNLSKYTNADIQHVEDWVNNYPREVLKYATSAELFERELQKIA